MRIAIAALLLVLLSACSHSQRFAAPPKSTYGIAVTKPAPAGGPYTRAREDAENRILDSEGR
jgi:hypothetical protein